MTLALIGTNALTGFFEALTVSVTLYGIDNRHISCLPGKDLAIISIAAGWMASGRSVQEFNSRPLWGLFSQILP